MMKALAMSMKKAPTRAHDEGAVRRAEPLGHRGHVGDRGQGRPSEMPPKPEQTTAAW